MRYPGRLYAVTYAEGGRLYSRMAGGAPAQWADSCAGDGAGGPRVEARVAGVAVGEGQADGIGGNRASINPQGAGDNRNRPA
jgi:hypothetical protein